MYKIVKNHNSVELEKEVTSLLNQGYRLHGSLVVSFSRHGNTGAYIQALIKEDTSVC